MLSDPSEAPETYLNKGQIYYLRVSDTAPPPSNTETTTYRTFVGVSFKEQQQGTNVEAYWRLWEARRALADLDTKGQEHRAVEFADQHNPQLELIEEFLNGFSVTWTISPSTNPRECNIPVRFNFLSTDFTLAKGVKGLSVRLCVKTDQVNVTEPHYQPEICFCKIRVFRDHGAERKFSNDVTNVRKRIQKLTERAAKSILHDQPRRRKRGNDVARNVKELKVTEQSLTNNMAGE
jgi:hypothetical protein